VTQDALSPPPTPFGHYANIRPDLWAHFWQIAVVLALHLVYYIEVSVRFIVNNESPQRIGPLLRQLREEAGLSVRGLAGAADVDSTWLSRVEHGIYVNPDPKKLNQLAKVLGVETMELFQAAEYAEGLPGFAPYMRTRYDLPQDAVDQLKAHFDLLAEKYGVEQEGSDDDHHSAAA